MACKELLIYLNSEPKLLREYQRNGMKADFSWDRMVGRYEAVDQGVARMG